MENKKLEPALRFPGFTDAWEQRKLGEIATFSKGFGYSKSDLRLSGKPIILYGRLYTKYETTIIDVDSYAELKEKSVISAGGEIIVPASGETAEEISRASVVAYAGVILGGDLNIIKVGNKVIPTFLAIALSGGPQQKELSKRAQGKSVVHIRNSDLKKVELSFPGIEEQNKIQNIFELLDNLITLHQRKLSDLQNLKAGLLQKMFPQNGSNVPEVRFPGFTDAWEQRKLGDIAERVIRKNANLDTKLPLTISAQHGLVDQNDYFGKRIASSNLEGYYLIQNGEFAYNKSTSNDAPWGAIRRLDYYQKGALSTLYIIFSIKELNRTDSNFLAIYYRTNLWHKGIKAIAAEGARNHGLLNISSSSFFETTLFLPKNIEEQKRIGDFFNELDNLITLHQRKLENLQNMKKSLLQQMFI